MLSHGCVGDLFAVSLNQLFIAAGLNYFGFYLNSGAWLKCREYNRINVFGWFGNRPLSQR